MSVGHSNRLVALSWSITASLLSFLCLTHLGVLACFTVGSGISASIAPLAAAGALMVGYASARRLGLEGRAVWWPAMAFVLLLLLSIAFSAAFYDMSWDGLWYHQSAIYQMEKGWNPIREPIIDLPGHMQKWVLHYAKGNWYIATAIYETTGHIEWGKCGQWLACATVFFSMLAMVLESGMKRSRAFMIAVLVSINPVMTCQLYSFYVDGLMIAYLACFAAAYISWMRRPAALSALIGTMAAMLCINTKFTGLVYLCLIMAGFGLYTLLYKRRLIFKYVTMQIAPLLLGIFVFGYNPYVTNTLHRGHPFYPLCGNTEYPGLLENGNDPIEKHETPKNMKGRNRFVRFGYALMGRPAFRPRDDAQLMIPFTATPRDMTLYYFHEQRLAGFGPFFSGAFLLGLLLLIPLFRTPGSAKWLVLLGIGTLLASLSISKHAWWARYGPQLWWVPIIPLCVVFWRLRKGWAVRYAWLVSAILLANALLVAVVHVKWEVEATQTLKKQMAELAGSGLYEFDFKWFGEPFANRLKTAGVSFRTLPRNSLRPKNAKPMLSVCPGYVGTILYRRAEEGSNLKNET
ncbi:MAG TPA: hypothetical protein VIR77_00705 [Pontiella sp.]